MPWPESRSAGPFRARVEDHVREIRRDRIALQRQYTTLEVGMNVRAVAGIEPGIANTDDLASAAQSHRRDDRFCHAHELRSDIVARALQRPGANELDAMDGGERLDHLRAVVEVRRRMHDQRASGGTARQYLEAQSLCGRGDPSDQRLVESLDRIDTGAQMRPRQLANAARARAEPAGDASFIRKMADPAHERQRLDRGDRPRIGAHDISEISIELAHATADRGDPGEPAPLHRAHELDEVMVIAGRRRPGGASALGHGFRGRAGRRRGAPAPERKVVLRSDVLAGKLRTERYAFATRDLDDRKRVVARDHVAIIRKRSLLGALRKNLENSSHGYPATRRRSEAAQLSRKRGGTIMTCAPSPAARAVRPRATLCRRSLQSLRPRSARPRTPRAARSPTLPRRLRAPCCARD